MAGILDKALFIAFGVVLVSASESSAAAVTAMLLGMIAAALFWCITEWRYRAMYMGVFVAGCFLFPELCGFLPILYYDCATEHRVFPMCATAPLLVVFHISAGYALLQEVLWLLLLLSASVLGYRAGEQRRLQCEMIRFRDSSTERNLALREKHQNLLEKQEYEIYLATLRERNRIAREMHDNVGHMLSRSILQVGALMTVHKEQPLCGELMSVNDTLGQAMNSIRESVHDLHDEAVDLRQALLEATREMRKEYQVTIDYDLSPEIPRSVKYCFIATVKEAMSNIIKHSDADRIALILREHPGFYQLTVEDNGTTAVDRTPGSRDAADGAFFERGIGLANMRERVEALQGVFRIHCEKGFQIFISIPKEQKDEGVGSR